MAEPLELRFFKGDTNRVNVFRPDVEAIPALKCGKKGHKAAECPNANGDNSSIQTDSMASQSHHSMGSRRSAGRSTRSRRSSGSNAWNA
eukprot:scaffold273_cov89-Cylindrotheca_fusiformis.AAC.2